MTGMQMKYLITLGKFKFYWAGYNFVYRGLWMWDCSRNIRVIPLNNFKNWTGKKT